MAGADTILEARALGRPLSIGMKQAAETAVQDAQELQSRFVTENLRRMFLQIYRIVGNVDDAQDLTQEAFIKALQRQDQIKDPQKAAHWLSRIASNTAIDFLRRHSRFTFCEVDDVLRPAGHAARRQSRRTAAAQRAGRLSRRRPAPADRARADGADPARRRRPAGRRSGAAHELLEGDGAVAHRQRAHQVPALRRGEKTVKHPGEDMLALFAGGDLGLLERWRVRSHLNRCEACRSELAQFETAGERAER